MTTNAHGSSHKKPLHVQFMEAGIKKYGLDASVDEAPQFGKDITLTIRDLGDKRDTAIKFVAELRDVFAQSAEILVHTPDGKHSFPNAGNAIVSFQENPIRPMEKQLKAYLHTSIGDEVYAREILHYFMKTEPTPA